MTQRLCGSAVRMCWLRWLGNKLSGPRHQPCSPTSVARKRAAAAVFTLGHRELKGLTDVYRRQLQFLRTHQYFQGKTHVIQKTRARTLTQRRGGGGILYKQWFLKKIFLLHALQMDINFYSIFCHYFYQHCV